MKKEKMVKIYEKVRARNKATFRLLISHPPFIEEVEEIRRLINPLPLETEERTKKFNCYLQSIEALHEKYKIPKHFKRVLSAYVQNGEYNEDDVPHFNFEITTQPRFLKNLSITDDGRWETNEHVREVCLSTFAQLDGDEIRLAQEILKLRQQSLFPTSRNYAVKREDADLDVKLRAEELSQGRERKHKEENSQYLEMLKASNPDDYEHYAAEYKRQVPEAEKIEEAYTGADIALILKEETGEDKSEDAIRAMLKRLKDEREERFG